MFINLNFRLILFSLRIFKTIYSTTGADGENYELFLDVKQVFLVIILVYITQIAVISYTITKTKDKTKRHDLRYKRRCCICVCVVLSFIRIGFRVIEKLQVDHSIIDKFWIIWVKLWPYFFLFSYVVLWIVFMLYKNLFCLLSKLSYHNKVYVKHTRVLYN